MVVLVGYAWAFSAAVGHSCIDTMRKVSAAANSPCIKHFFLGWGRASERDHDALPPALDTPLAKSSAGGASACAS